MSAEPQVRFSMIVALTKRLSLLAFAAAAFLPGCALSKSPYHAKIVSDSLPPNTTIPPSWTASRNTSEASNNWLESFHDSQLQVTVEQTISRNLDLRQAAENVEIARQNVSLVASQLKPQISATFGLHTLRDKDDSSNFNSSEMVPAISWEPDVWGHLRAQRAAARAGYEATALDYDFARQSLAATTAMSWYQAVSTVQLIAVDQEAVTTYAELLRLTKAKFAAGQVAQLNVAEASADVEETENQLLLHQELLSEEQRDLEVLAGDYPAASLKVATEFVRLPPPIQPGLPSDLLERRPDVASAERQVLAQFRGLEASRLALFPSFSLGADGGRLFHEALSVLRLSPWFYQAAIGMDVPIYTGGALRTEVKIANAGQRQAVAHYGSVALNAFREVEIALTNEDLFAERLQYMEQALSDRTESVRLATLKYKDGAIDLLPVLQLQASQLATKSEVVKLHNALLANRITLHLALGGSFDAAPAASIK